MLEKKPNGSPDRPAKNAVYGVIYAAKSTKDRKLSIPEQLDDCREMAEEHGWTIVGEFKDEGFTAYTGNRGPGLAAAIKLAKDTAAETASIVMLVAQHTSRFARGDGAKPGAAKALVELYHEWARCNVKGRLVENDHAMASSSAAAQQGEADNSESKRKGKSVKKGLRRRARDRGKLSGGPRAYGYRWVGERLEKRLEVVPSEAEIAKNDIFLASVNGMSQLAITRALNKREIPTVRGGKWTQASVRRVLTNPLYMGQIKHDGQVYPGIHEPIVSAELWQAAAAVREAAIRTKGHGGGRRPKGPHLMTKGLLRCGSCGSALIPRSDPRRRGGDYFIYRCDGQRQHGPDHCSQPPLEQATVDTALLGELTRKYIDLDATRERIEQRMATDSARSAEALAQAEGQATAAVERYQRVQRAFQDGIIEADDWAEQRPGLIADRDAAEAEVNRVREHARLLADAAPMLDAETELLRHLADLRAAVVDGIGQAPNLDATRTVLRRLFTRIEYLPAGHPLLESWLKSDDLGDWPQAAGGYLVPNLRDDVIEDWILTNPRTGEAIRMSEDTREPACGHTLHDGACPDCRAFDDELTAEPYDGRWDETPTIRKATLPLEPSKQPLPQGLTT